MGCELLVKDSRMSTESSSSQLLEESLNKPYSNSIREALDQYEYNFVITDPYLSDHPIVYASEGFLKMTGYSRGEVLGRNSRFLQGPETDRRTVLEIREAIRQEKSCQVSILNYRKDGTTFWNFFHLAPVFSKEEGRVIHFLGLQTPISQCSRVCRSGATNKFSCSTDRNCPTCVGKVLFSQHASSANSSSNSIYFGSCRRSSSGTAQEIWATVEYTIRLPMTAIKVRIGSSSIYSSKPSAGTFWSSARLIVSLFSPKGHSFI